MTRISCDSRRQTSRVVLINVRSDSRETQSSNGGEKRQMESLNPRQQHLDPGRQSSFQSLALNNVRSASRASASFSVTSPFGNYPEPTSVNYRATMVSTTSTPTPSTQMSPFYLLREDTRELTNLFFHLWLCLS